MRPYTTINTIFTIWLKLNFVPVISIKSWRLSDAYMRLWSYHIGSDNGLSPGRRQAIIWTNAGMLLNGPLGTNFNQISFEILMFSLKTMYLKMSSAK